MIYINNEFKTIQFALYFTDNDDIDTRVYRFLLSKLIVSHTKKYQTKALMHKKLEELYGASLYARVERHANLNILGVVFTCVNPLMVKDDELLLEVITLINEMFVNRSYFNEDIFLEEKRLLIEQFDSLKDNKRVYANYEFTKLLFDQDLYGYPLPGRIEDIKKVTLKDVIDYYQKSFLDQDIKLYVNGSIKDYTEQIKNQILIKENEKDFNIDLSFRPARKHTFKEEMTTMNQAILKLAYHTSIYRFDDLYETLLCFDLILGGYPESRLFKEIREAQGLCYDVSSGYDYYKGIIVITSGVAKDKKDYALNEIKKLVEDFKENEITEDELTHAKNYIKHQIQSSMDHQSYLTKSTFLKSILKENVTTEQRIKRLEDVKLEDVIKISKSIILDTSYALYGGQK
ncbi:MAG: insulinase family protein [Acholeplasmataceae bacterium]|nr:insulinase family protein [Acholeplasmataceae bacterium]